MSYSKPAVSFLSATGDQEIDGLLSGLFWVNPALTFSFPTSADQYDEAGAFTYDGFGFTENKASFVAFNATQKAAVRAILAEIEKFTPLTFTEVTEETVGVHGTLRFATMPTAYVGSTAFAYFPSTSVRGGDCWFNSGGLYSNPIKGNYAYFTIVHEIGHALGLKHGHTGGGVSGVTLPTNKDAIEFSVMTYRSYINGGTSGYTTGGSSYPHHFMIDDIAALQSTYGANYSTRAGKTYSFSNTTGEMFIDGVGQGVPAGNKINCCIWDGGNGTLDVSALSPTPKVIQIGPGAYSRTDVTSFPTTGGRPPTGNIYVAKRYSGNTASDFSSSNPAPLISGRVF